MAKTNTNYSIIADVELELKNAQKQLNEFRKDNKLKLDLNVKGSKSLSDADGKVKKLDDQVVEIDVCEKKQIAYTTIGSYQEIIFVDGTNVEINDSNKYLMSKLPEMTGFTSEQLNTVLRGFKNIDQKTINEISEINRYSFSYDENMMEVIMKDGNICFVSWTGLSMLDKYYSIVSGLDTSMGYVCIYLDELTNSGYVSICPWQE